MRGKKHKLGLNFLNLNLENFLIQNLELVDWIVSVIYNLLIFIHRFIDLSPNSVDDLLKVDVFYMVITGCENGCIRVIQPIVEHSEYPV
uniref:Uncharacterized protein n=1 Tax=Vitis vinifera TaxID=29760 RepID=F6HPH8_VITVI